jgi:lipoprotein-anchoring transpeptidase ErfK/SrfK
MPKTAAPAALALALTVKAVFMPTEVAAQGITLPASCRGMVYMRDGSLCPALNNYATQRAALEDPWARHGVAKPVDVAYLGAEPENTIIIDRKNDYLYLVLAGGRARKYVIAQGQVGSEMPSDEILSVFAVRHNPTWRPTAAILKRYPDLEDRTYEGGPTNPLGVRGTYLARGIITLDQIRTRRVIDSLFRIHGTNQPSKLAKPDGQRKVSSGCIRMHNEDSIDFARRIEAGMRAGVVFTVKVVNEGLGADLVRQLGDASPSIWQPAKLSSMG